MRPLFVAIVVVAIGYLGWVLFQGSRATTTPTQEAKLEAPTATAAAPPSRPAATRSSALPPSAPARQTGRPGVFYAVERVTRESDTGVKALNRGEEVRLMYRYKNGKMLVTNGRDEFIVPPSSLTPDPEEARRPTPP